MFKILGTRIEKKNQINTNKKSYRIQKIKSIVLSTSSCIVDYAYNILIGSYRQRL